MRDEKVLLSCPVHATTDQPSDSTLQNEYGIKEQKSINAFLQQLKSFKSPTEVKLDDVEPASPVSQDDSVKGKGPRNASLTTSNEIDIDRILMGKMFNGFGYFVFDSFAKF